MKIIYALLRLLVVVSLPNLLFAQNNLKIYSPDRSIRMDVFIADGSLHYKIVKNNQQILEKSAMVWMVNKNELGKSVYKITKLKEEEHLSTYPTRGSHSLAVDKYRAVTAVVRSKDFPDFSLDVRVFNDGVAFRYHYLHKGRNEIDDHTTFALPVGSSVWSQNDISYYEGLYYCQNADSLKLNQQMGPPVVVQYPGKKVYAAISEAGLVDFAGMALRVSDQRTMKALLSGETIKQGQLATPWRVIMVGSLNELVNTDMITNLSDPADKLLFKDASKWIKPGLSVWSWLTEYNVSSKYKVLLEDMKRFSKWAGELGIPYNLVDDGWGDWKEGNKDCWALMKELVDYSAKQNVKVWLWKAYPDFKGLEGIQTVERRRAFFKKCKDIGVVGIKIDFFNNEGQEITKFYHDALKDAAEQKLMINFHGSNKPTGINRTFPNEMSREGIQGNEGGANSMRAITLPFTRLLVGHGDYTPLILNKDLKGDTSWNQKYNRELMGGTSWCYQMATAFLYSSPLLCLSVNPTDLLSNPYKDLICNMPVIWDETIVLPPSEIGELVLMARRSGKDWYVTGLTQKAIASINVNLSFLKKGKYKAYCVKDDPDQQTNAISETIAVTANHHLPIYMNHNGGFVAKISPW